MWTVLTLIVVGAALLLLETILPGLISGILGMCLLVAGVVVGYTTYGVTVGNIILLGVSLGLVIGVLVWAKYFPESRLAGVFISKRTVGELKVDRPELVGQTGIAQTLLRPSGMAVVNGQRVDVVTEGPLIEAGTPIRIVAVEGMRVVVRAL
jgi:membrane-bound serine protease (ClpP class)